ncbi:hypothetical protein IB265_33045 [Ensifer sp. ENS10]|uniref:hypothetical protein n=1 Tax=Ensifer sp. ENS10 TaxID=2769286 RepID=UPI0017803129|nr:hypothetical protein [Ensifer sp. ENS10]MBD9511585.1 hypothetical protein [Ensifer sp. ENS10]
MSRTRRTVLWFAGKPQPMERTWRGLGDTEPFFCEMPRRESAHGFDGANRDGRHPNTKRREKRANRRPRFQERAAFDLEVE